MNGYAYMCQLYAILPQECECPSEFALGALTVKGFSFIKHFSSALSVKPIHSKTFTVRGAQAQTQFTIRMDGRTW